MWFRTSSAMLNIPCNGDVYLGISYIPPDGSPYYIPETFSQLHNEISGKLSVDSNNSVFIIGDLNARTGVMPDFITTNSVDQDIFPNDMIDFMNDVDKLKLAGISLERASQDKGKPNSHGYKLIDLCKNNNLYIVNGRAGQDKGVGKGVSLVDYAVASANIFPSIIDFEIRDFEPLFSDIHSPVIVTLDSNTTVLSDQTPSSVEDTSPHPRKWNRTLATEYVDSVDKDVIQSIELELQKTTYCNPVDVITSVNDKISNVLLSSAGKVFSFVKRCKRRPACRKRNKLWFGKQCKITRGKYFEARRNFKKHSTLTNKQRMINASKSYKKCLIKFSKKYTSNLQEKILRLEKNDPRSFVKTNWQPSTTT